MPSDTLLYSIQVPLYRYCKKQLIVRALEVISLANLF